MDEIIKTAREVIQIEADMVAALVDRVDTRFAGAVKAIIECKGHVIFLGIGKSGIIAQKIAATMSSTGTPAYFVHPVEGMHGDLGMLRRGDIVVALSNSGETAELLNIIPSLIEMEIPIIALTGVVDSSLGNAADYVIDCAVEREACPLGLAPTSSTTAALAMGDALAVCLMRKREFKEREFALFHPGGSLGKRLLTRISEIMNKGDKVPIVAASAVLPEIVEEITEKTFGVAAVIDRAGALAGVISDGDLRRLIGRGEINDQVQAADFMTPSPKTIKSDSSAAMALHIMEEYGITSLFICDDNDAPIGLIHLHDILGRGVVRVEGK